MINAPPVLVDNKQYIPLNYKDCVINPDVLSYDTNQVMSCLSSSNLHAKKSTSESDITYSKTCLKDSDIVN